MVFWCAVSSDQVTLFVPMRAGSCREALMSAWLLRSCPSFVTQLFYSCWLRPATSGPWPASTCQFRQLGPEGPLNSEPLGAGLGFCAGVTQTAE